MKFNTVITFKKMYRQVIVEMNDILISLDVDNDNEENLTNIIPITNLEKWTIMNGISFVMDKDNIRSEVIRKLNDSNKQLISSLFDDKLIISKFFSDKQEEIENEFKIIDTNPEFLDTETGFLRKNTRKYEDMTKLNIYIYIFKFLLSKSLLIFRNYTNNFMRNTFTEEQKKVILSIGAEHFSKIYEKRYNKIYSLEKSAKYVKYEASVQILVKDIITLLSMVDPEENNIKDCEEIIKDLIIKFIFLMGHLLSGEEFEYNHFSELTNLFFEELESSIETHKTRQYDIKTYLDIKKTKENQKRKDKFDSKNEEDKLSHRLYRRFGLGNLLDTIKNVNEEVPLEDVQEYEEVGYDNEDQNIDNDNSH